VYSGFERAAGVALRPGSEEYRDSEKYQCTAGQVGGDLSRLVRRCNEIRRASDVFRHVDNVTFVETAHERLITYVKGRGAGSIIVCVNLDPHDDAEGLATIPDSLGLPTQFGVVDLLSGDRYEWRVGGNYLRLPPGAAHVLAVR
jgi:starch synthase (maltosyl-transferring)